MSGYEKNVELMLNNSGQRRERGMKLCFFNSARRTASIDAKNDDFLKC